jgi:hypothetical protein
MKVEKWSHDKYDEIAQEEKVWGGIMYSLKKILILLILEETILFETAIGCTKTAHRSPSVDRENWGWWWRGTESRDVRRKENESHQKRAGKTVTANLSTTKVFFFCFNYFHWSMLIFAVFSVGKTRFNIPK